MASTTLTERAVAGLPDDKRREIVRRLTDDLMAAKLDAGTALLMLDCLGLTGDRDVLSHGMAARYMRDGLRDGTIDPKVVNPEIVVRDAAEVLATGYDEEFEDAIATLATLRPLPAERPVCNIRTHMHPDARNCPLHGEQCVPAERAS